MSISRWIRRREPKLVPIGPAVWQLPMTFECLNPLTPPPMPPCVSWGNLFGVYPFLDEYAHVYQIWCQSVQPFHIFRWLFNLWLLTPPPKISWGKLYLAYVHSQTNPQTCTKFGANRSSRLTASPDFLICDPLKPPEMPLCVLKLNLFGIYPFPD